MECIYKKQENGIELIDFIHIYATESTYQQKSELLIQNSEESKDSTASKEQ